MKAMILAAGLGTRLRPYTETCPKPALAFLNIPLMNYTIHLLSELGAHDWVINTHHLPEQVKACALAALGRSHVHFSDEPEKPLGSGGGIWQARSHLMGEKSFIVANGDEVILPSRRGALTQLFEQHSSSDALATILVKRDPRVGTQFGGVWADSQGLIAGFGKSAPDIGRTGLANGVAPSGTTSGAATALTGYHYVGVLALNSRVFDYLPDGESNILYDALVAGIKSGERCEIFYDDSQWFETGNPHDYLAASLEALRLLAQKQETLSAIHAHYAGSKFVIRGTGKVFEHESSLVRSGAKFNGSVIIGAGATIAARVTLEDCVVLPGAQILEGEHKGKILA